MFVFCSVVVIAACLQVHTAQGHPDIPSECRGPPPGVERPMDCCKIPHIFEASILKDCGFEMSENGERPQIRKHHTFPHFGTAKPLRCTKHKCLFEKSNLIKDGEYDKEAASALLDQWAETNTEFKPNIATAKEKCIEKDPPGPPHLCEEMKRMFCVFHTLYNECPIWEDSDECKIVKEHMDQCLPHLNKLHKT